MPVQTRDISSKDDSFPYIFEQNVSVPLHTCEEGLIRVNLYRPHDSEAGVKYPVLVTYGPYGKDVHYENFRKASFDEVNPDHKSVHSAWETPDPAWWTKSGYIIVRADERGIGQSPGVLDTMSRSTSEAFCDVIEWAADQPWSNGKVGLLGISYYAGTQWRVAARNPRGLAAIIPWEGMSDYYRDRCRHGGILSNSFIDVWWHGQVIVNQYGRPRPSNSFVPPTIEGQLAEKELLDNLRDQTVDNVTNEFTDQEYYASREYTLEDIQVPLLSVANWGGILLHLRGNVEGYAHAGSKIKYLRFITGRHDLPFYQDEEARLQKSFLDAFLKNKDDRGWTIPGKLAPVSVILREGDVGFNSVEKERQYLRRDELAWPLSNTVYTKYYLLPNKTMTSNPSEIELRQKDYLSWKTMKDAPWSTRVIPGRPPVRDFAKQSKVGMIQFKTAPFSRRTEFTGHVTANLHVCIPSSQEGNVPTDIDIFVTVRHLDITDKEIFYTGTAGDPVPVTKGWLRCSLRKIKSEHPNHRPYLPHRDYFSTDVQPLVPDTVYPVVVEIWPTNVVVSPGNSLVFEIAGADTQGSGIFTHDHPLDRPNNVFEGRNELRFGVGDSNYLTMPIIPSE
ncbi:Alpha/Beta hydrolase protein [Talaromyces proteolyticus]|uniref:Alpha/Beta hydrolase protein n=1 Tax=Talaromyces proteolyticus TaxID=1131652 RepID=A0AAD4KLJ5_9EURO|nr:Alpha/Beta hydrolase protein [Talaromyces proteolyticus]KAH8691272.1 Alpha/Beta hydrolase protein [Talaromyces proteolyticus]